MKATIRGIEVEGTPKEIVEYQEMLALAEIKVIKVDQNKCDLLKEAFDALNKHEISL
jgi:hypothetical protein